MARFRLADAPGLIRAARLDAGLTQAELADRAGIRPADLAQMESGRRAASSEMLERVLRAADYRPSLPLAQHAAAIVERARSLGFSNVRVFGSTARGEDGFGSDIDLLVTPSPSTDLFDLALLADEVEELTGFRADVVSDSQVPDAFANAVRDAVRL